jgi:hypothetical protein
MKNTIRYFKLELVVIAILFLNCVFAIAQTVVGDVNSSLGNAKLMQHNMNEPHVINPAKNNNQKYEKGEVKIETEHPDKNLSNQYNRSHYSK